MARKEKIQLSKQLKPHPFLHGLHLTVAESLLLHGVYFLLFSSLLGPFSTLLEKLAMSFALLAAAVLVTNPLSLLRLRLLLRHSGYPSHPLQLYRRVREEAGLIGVFGSGLLPRVLYHLGILLHTLALFHGFLLAFEMPSTVAESRTVPLTAMLRYLL